MAIVMKEKNHLTNLPCMMKNKVHFQPWFRVILVVCIVEVCRVQLRKYCEIAGTFMLLNFFANALEELLGLNTIMGNFNLQLNTL